MVELTSLLKKAFSRLRGWGEAGAAFFFAGRRALNTADISVAMLQELSNRSYLEKLREQAPISQLVYTFDQPLAGNGWFPRESRDGVFWRFTGPGDQASIIFPRVCSGVTKARLTVFHSVTPEHLSSLHITLNGVKLRDRHDLGNTIEFPLPAGLLDRDDCPELVIHTLPGQRPLNRDSRMIGLAFTKIEIV